MKVTKSFNPSNVQSDWYHIDADGKILGRLAAEVARRLRGKHKVEYTPHADLGDFIVITNAEKIAVKGNNKLKQKTYYHHTGYPGGIKSCTLHQMLDERPIKVIEKAVKGMLPRGPLGQAMFRKLKVYAGSKHPHKAQQPKSLEI